jgi:uncharacterized membrane protein YraQ (UPF0718 family)
MNLVGDIAYVAQLVILQFKRIVPFWLAGLLVGSAVSVFFSSVITGAMAKLGGKGSSSQARALGGSALAAVLGAVSPLCMYGTVPLIAVLGRGGAREYILASFMISSILINPNLFVFSLALGTPLALLRLGACLVAGTLAGAAVRVFMKEGTLFDFSAFDERLKVKGSPGARAYFASVGRGIHKTAPYFLAGIFLTALFDLYFPRELATSAFGSRRGLGPLIAASVGVPVYVCGGATIPLLRAWLGMGMTAGSAIAFCLSGPATKLTNLGAVKIILGARNFMLYLCYTIGFAVVAGIAIDAVLGIAG